MSLNPRPRFPEPRPIIHPPSESDADCSTPRSPEPPVDSCFQVLHLTRRPAISDKSVLQYKLVSAPISFFSLSEVISAKNFVFQLLMLAGSSSVVAGTSFSVMDVFWATLSRSATNWKWTPRIFVDSSFVDSSFVDSSFNLTKDREKTTLLL